MIHYKIYIDKYNWSIEVFIVLSEVDIDAILRSIEKAEGSKKTLQMSYDSLTQGYNTGFTYSNMEL
jgi:hypothetical protein